MAAVLQLTDGTTTVDFLSGYLRIEFEGWSTATATDLTWETINLVSRGATDAQIRTTQAQIDALLEKARDYIADPLNADPVWFYWQSDGESGKRSLVYDGASSIRVDNVLGPLLGKSNAKLTIAIQHDPLYESTSTTTVTQNALSADGGTWAIVNAAGTAPQRISLLKIESSVPSALYKAWFGIRPLYKGTAGFIPTWECEDGSNGTDTADAADASASDGNKVTVTFATNTALVTRSTIRWGNVAGSNYDDIVGSYLVLLRCKVDAAGTEVKIQARHGWIGNAGMQTSVGETYISGQTSYALVEMGVVDIPPTGNRDAIGTSGDEIQNYAIVIAAERVSASGTLDLDCVYLVPADYLVTMNYGGIDMRWYTRPDGSMYAVAKNSSSQFANVESSFADGWSYPALGGLAVFVAQANGVHALGKTADMSISLIPRYLTFRT